MPKRTNNAHLFFTCPNCGGEVPIKALACPHCGSDEETGWSEEAKYAHLLPAYEEKPSTTGQNWRQIGIIAVASLVLSGTLVTTLGVSLSRYVIPIVLLVVAAYFFFQQRGGFTVNSEARLYQQLLQQARGDRDLADRLILSEQRRHPEASRAQHIQDALDRWQRDRR